MAWIGQYRGRTGRFMAGVHKWCQLDVALLGLALVGGVASFVAPIASEPLAIDEHVSFWIADQSSPGSLFSRSYYYSATPPFSFALQTMAISLCGEREWCIRLPAAASFVASIISVWWIGRRWLTPLAGGIAAVLMAVHPVLASVATAGRPYGVGVLFAALAMHFSARLTECPTVRCWLTLTVVNLALVQTHYLFASVWIAQFLWLEWARWKNRLDLRRVSIWLLTVLGCASTALPGLWRVWNHRQYLNWTTHQPTFFDVLPVAIPVQMSWAFRPLAWSLLFLPFLWLTIRSGWRPREWFAIARETRERAFLVRAMLWLIVPIGVFYVLGRFWLESLAADRYLVVFAPATAIVWSGLLCMLRGSVAPVIGLVVLVIGSGFVERSSPSILRMWAKNGSNSAGRSGSVSLSWREVAQEISREARDGSVIWVGSGLAEMSLVPMYADDLIFHDYASSRLGRMYLKGSFRRLSLPMFWTPDLERFFRAELRRACDGAVNGDGASPTVPNSIWLVAATDTDLLAASARRAQWLLESSGARPRWTGEFAGLTAVRYDCSSLGSM